MAEDAKLDASAATFGTVAALNIILDVMVTTNPAALPLLDQQLRSKIAEWESAHFPALPFLQMLHRDLLKSARAAERQPPQGSA